VGEWSKQGVNIAFIGLNHNAQTSCAEYLRKAHLFKRINMDDGVKYFLRQMYDYNGWKNILIKERRLFYDAIYKVDPNIFISHVTSRIRKSENDIVISDVRYLNEMQALQKLNFKIVRVTTPLPPKIGVYVKGAAAGTTALSSLYDKNFAVKHNVEYSINFTTKANLSTQMDTLLASMGYNLTNIA
jgi:hypothetical protein